MIRSGHDLTAQDLGLSRISGEVYRNLEPCQLKQFAVDIDQCAVAKSGALLAYSGTKTGRSPKDKRIVVHPESQGNVWWGEQSPNQPLSADSYNVNRDIAVRYLEHSRVLFVQDGFVNWGLEARVKVRVICTRPYHALFMHNMMIRPSKHEFLAYGVPDFVIYNAGKCPADPNVPGVESETSVVINIERGEMLILGTEYAGEMKKGIFSVMHYMMPRQNILTLHSGCNVGEQGDTTLFFGLSGTGKTTLSSDPSGNRQLIGDDEHGWASLGIFNIEGGCYAKCINLSPENEPDIFQAIRDGAVLENVVADPATGEVDYDDCSITENSRASYPIDHIRGARIPCIGPHPKNIILLCCDAFGVLPPVARLTRAQMMYHFCAGYTAKVAGTEVGVKKPTATFSPCFGGAFLMWHPMKYAAMLAQRTDMHGSSAWFVNTGWSGGSYGVGNRISLKHTRAIIDAIHTGELDCVEYVQTPIFGFLVPMHVTGVPDAVLQPRATWSDHEAYDAQLVCLAQLFASNMNLYQASQYVNQELIDEIRLGGPQFASVDTSSHDEIESSPTLPRVSSCAAANGSAIDSVNLLNNIKT
eukprot:jgi/Ulvmu1/2762/UM014_0220.1